MKIITESSSNQKNEILGAIKPEIEFWDKYKFKAELNTNHLSKLQLTVSDLPIEGSKIDVIYTQDPNKTDAANELEGKGTYKYQRFAANLGASYQIETKSPKFKGQLAVNFPDNVYWSVADEFSNYIDSDEKPQWDISLDGKVSYVQPTYEALGNIVYKKKEKKTTCSASWYQGLGSVNYGVIFSTTLNNEGANIMNSLDVAGENKTNSGAILKGRISTASKPKSAPTVRGALSVAQKVSPGFTVTIGADINCRHLFNIENSDSLPHSFGFEVKLND